MPGRIYFISGLGADRRAFQRLRFPPDYELVYLDWITPKTEESLENYALRLSNAIDTRKPFYLVGLSFGGMLATEIAKRLQPNKTFIISSVPTSKSLPWYYKFAGKLKLHQLISQFAKRTNPVTYALFGLKKRSEKNLLDQIIADTDINFLKWALSAILKWRNEIKPADLIHIHGTADNILPVKFTQPDRIIVGGGHLMVYTHAQEITNIIVGS
ncbi:alpha/beta fold hydrolase [Pedobacter faecalis]|uniref:alpha/beta fold hydrolase n=1 Tax=Pedobacter faecalis TaxID=3041495 RepID=UPI00254F3D17|nr:alpha/beta hydrolase [Pedobacter sp. ELA7]